MAKLASVLTSIFALLLGFALGAGGLYLLLEADTFATAHSETQNGPLGLWGASTQTADIGTAAWVGLLIALFGGGLSLLGIRALFVALEGRNEV